jgi:hypothetical protein
MNSFIQDSKTLFLENYSSYVDRFKQKNVEMDIKINKVSYIKSFVTIVAEIKFIPQKEYRNKNDFWKIFAVKLITLRQTSSSSYKCVLRHKKSLFFEFFLNKHLYKLSRKTPCEVCTEDLKNLFLRIFFFSRFQRFPESYRGKDLSLIYFIIVLLFLGIIVCTISTWYAWY